MRKKIIASAIAIWGATSIVFAINEPQAVVTECGTVHAILSNSSIDFAVEMLDYWTNVDC